MSYWDSEYYRNKRRFDTTYDTTNSPYSKYLEERNRINIAVFGLDNSGITKPPQSCPDHLNIPLIAHKNGVDFICRECGVWTPEKLQPPPAKKTTAQKIKQKSAEQSKTFIKPLPERKRKGGKLGNIDDSESLSDNEYRWVSQMYGNIVEGSETEESSY